MRRIARGFLATVMVVLTTCSSAYAESFCMDRDRFLVSIKNIDRVLTISAPISWPDGTLGLTMEVYSNPNDGGWTMVTVDEVGQTCVRIEGFNFEMFTYVF